MGWYYEFQPYVPVAQRRAQAAREVAKRPKKGQAVSPVGIEGRTIATTFWGKAWCDNLEAYSDFANRLPRGRTYVRNGSVVDLQIETGQDHGAGERLGAVRGRDRHRRRCRSQQWTGPEGAVRGPDRLAGRTAARQAVEGA